MSISQGLKDLNIIELSKKISKMFTGPSRFLPVMTCGVVSHFYQSWPVEWCLIFTSHDLWSGAFL